MIRAYLLLILAVVPNYLLFGSDNRILQYELTKPYTPTERSYLTSGLLLAQNELGNHKTPHLSFATLDNGTYATTENTIPHPTRYNFLKSKYAGFIIPVGLMTYGIVTRGNPALQKLDHNIKDYAGQIFPGRTYVDDYLQWSPLAAMYVLQLSGVKSQNGWLNMTIAAATSYIIMEAAVYTIKSTANVKRPDSSARNSFPSGHTATAFVGAHLLYKEYKHISPWIGVAGYTAATSVAVLRILNRRHWLSDTVMGAGIGIASVEIAYLLLPIFDRWIKPKNISDKDGYLSLLPVSSHDYTGVGITYSF